MSYFGMQANSLDSEVQFSKLSDYSDTAMLKEYVRLETIAKIQRYMNLVKAECWALFIRSKIAV